MSHGVFVCLFAWVSHGVTHTVDSRDYIPVWKVIIELPSPNVYRSTALPWSACVSQRSVDDGRKPVSLAALSDQPLAVSTLVTTLCGKVCRANNSKPLST